MMEYKVDLRRKSQWAVINKGPQLWICISIVSQEIEWWQIGKQESDIIFS